MSAPLSFQELHSQQDVADGVQPRVSVWLHSLLTSSKFLASTAQNVIDAAAAATGAPWTAVLLDQRCHGASLGLPGLDPPHTVDAMAGDALATLLWGMQEGRWGQPEVLVGHSIGGLVVMEMAQRLGAAAAQGGPAELAALGVPRQVWLLDSRATPIANDSPCLPEMRAFIGTLRQLAEPMASLDDVAQPLAAILRSAGLAPPPWLRDGFCAHVVKPAPGGQGVVRQYDAAVVDEMLASYVEQDYTALVAAPPPGCALHLAWGTAGAQWVKDGAEELEHWRAQTAAGKPVKLHEMAGAGHWIPASHPQELLAAMAGELPALK